MKRFRIKFRDGSWTEVINIWEAAMRMPIEEIA